MFPYLAEGVADFYLPAFPLPKAIADTDPSLTEQLKHVLSEAAEGRADPNTIAPESQSGLVPTLKEAGPMVLGVFDPIRRLDLMMEQKEQGRWRRKYRVLMGNVSRYWIFDLTPARKIVSMQPSSE